MFNWLYLILGALVLIAIIYIVFKFPESKLYVFTFLGVCLVGLTFYCGYQLNAYYHSKGGIFGVINGIFDTNVVKVDEMTISLSNIELTQDHEDVYSAKVVSGEVMSLSANEEYSILVNGVPCSSVDSSSDYVIAEYEYSFLDENLEELCTDTLFIRFSFYTNSTYLSVSTSGGANAVKYWNYYFNKNEFDIELFSSEYSSEATLNYTRGQIDYSKLAKVSYYLDENKVLTQVYLKGQKLVLPNTFIDDDFYCWSLVAGENWEKIDEYNSGSGYVVQSDFNLYAILLEDRTVTYISNNEVVFEEIVKTGFNPTFVSLEDAADYIFKGWSLDGVNVIDHFVYVVEDDTEFIAVWQIRQMTLEICNIDINCSSTSVNVDYYGTYTLTPPTINGLTFVEWKLMSGDGSISGNTFTAGHNTTSAKVCAVYDKMVVCVVSQTNCEFSNSGGERGSFVSVNGTSSNSAFYTYLSNSHYAAFAVSDSRYVTVSYDSDVVMTINNDTHNHFYTINGYNVAFIKIFVKAS